VANAHQGLGIRYRGSHDDHRGPDGWRLVALTPSGYEFYFERLARLIRTHGTMPSQEDIARLMAEHGTFLATT
jgi:hypothetical protein